MTSENTLSSVGTENLEAIALRDQLQEARDQYYNGQPIMSDDQFDVLEARLRELSPDDPFFSEVGSAPTGPWGKHTHEVPMGSLNKIKQEGTGENTNVIRQGIADWFAVTEERSRS